MQDIIELFKNTEPILVGTTNYYPAALYLLQTTDDQSLIWNSQYVNPGSKGDIRLGYYTRYFVRTSDGQLYDLETTSTTYTHVWDHSQDLIDPETGEKYKYVIGYGSYIIGADFSENIKTPLIVFSMQTIAAGNNSAIGGRAPEYIIALNKTNNPSTSTSRRLPGVSNCYGYLYIEDTPEAAVSTINPGNYLPYINAKVFINKNNNLNLAKWCRIGPNTIYVDTPIIAIHNVPYNANYDRPSELKYLNIRNLEEQEKYPGTLEHMYPPKLINSFYNDLITGLKEDGMFARGSNMKVFTLKNATQWLKTAPYQKSVFDTLIIDTVTTMPTLGNSRIKNLILPNISILTSSIPTIYNLEYLDLSGVTEVTTSSLLSSSENTTGHWLKELDLSSLEKVSSATIIQYGRALQIIHLKENFDFSLDLGYCSQLSRECLLDIFNKAKTLSPEDEKFQVNYITLSELVKNKLSKADKDILLNKGWLIK